MISTCDTLVRRGLINKTYDTPGIRRLIWKKYGNLVHIGLIDETRDTINPPELRGLLHVKL